mmetsp:Transcript_21209/g.32751  ORF Transcript_21209/g.32751 Transcript_21209/m.32751 type:complete len:114 (+) Transcript_21209:205-546(+)
MQKSSSDWRSVHKTWGKEVKDAQINLIEEECAPDMEQRRNYAALKDAQIKSSKEEYVGGMGQRKSVQQGRMHNLCCQRRSVRQAWSKMDKQEVQLRWVYELCPERRSVHQARG